MSEETTPAPAAPPGPEAALRERVGALLGPGAVPDHAGALSAWRVAPEALREACRTLRDAGFEYLMVVTAADRPAEGRFELLYVLARYDAAGEVALLTDVDRAAPAIDTVSDLWAAADWHEREVYDLFGVVFRNHPFLRRILLDEDWPGHPLRKDYVDTVHDVVRRPT